MFSKPLLLFVSLALVSGCSLRLNEEVQPKKLAITAGQGCLSNAGDVLDRFSKGTIEEPELESFWVCLENAFSTFSQHSTGSSDDYFTPEELSKFFSKKVIKKPIPDALLREAMALKQAVVGGDKDRITRAELRHTLTILRAFHKASLELRPFMPITHDAFVEKKYTDAQFEAAMKAFLESTALIGAALEQSQGSYELDRLSALFRELSPFLYNREVKKLREPGEKRPRLSGAERREMEAKETWLDKAYRWSSALRPAKGVFISPPQDEIRSSDWAQVYILAPRYYSLYLRARFFGHSPRQFLFGEGLERLEFLFTSFVDLFNGLLKNRPGETLNIQEIDSLIEALAHNDMLPNESESSAKVFVRALFGKIFSKAGASEFVINRSSLDRLKENFRFASEGLRALEAVYVPSAKGVEVPENALTKEAFLNIGEEIMLDSTLSKDELSREAVRGLRDSVMNVQTVFLRSKNSVFIPSHGQNFRYSHSHLATMHLFRTINRMLLQAYGTKGSDGLTESEIQTILDDMLPLAEDLGVLAGNSKVDANKRLLEASLFLPSSDGDKGLSMLEAMEFESLLFSTLFTAKEVHENLLVPCPSEERNERNQIVIQLDCYRKNFLEAQEKIWSYVPGFSAYVKGKSEREQRELFDLMSSILRKVRKDDSFNLSDTRAFVLLPYYVELLFYRYDENRDGKLSNKEAENAYKVFQPLIASVGAKAGYDTPSAHKDIYMFLLGYQENPQKAKASWVYRKMVGHKPFNVDRSQVLKIFEIIFSFEGSKT